MPTHLHSKPWAANWIEKGRLGGGGQGDTLLVEDANGRLAVLKILKRGKAKNAKARRRMAQEVTHLRVIHSAGGKVPKVLEANTEGFESVSLPLFFVMEFIDGKTLADTVSNSGGLPVSAAVGIALDLCQTLQIAIKEGISHRDLKPENIMIRSLDPPEAVIVDFGISFDEDTPQHLTDVDETFDNKFISLPERRGPGENKRDPRSDLTGICAILLYCLTGCIPRNLRSSDGKPPHHWPGYSLSGKVKDVRQTAVLDRLLTRGFTYEIEHRFQTVTELIGRLKEVIEPDAKRVDEDLDTVLARESSALRKADRKTQLAHFQDVCIPPLQKQMDDLFRPLWEKVASYKVFSLLLRQAFIQVSETCPDGDIISRSILDLKVLNHSGLSVCHTIVSRGPECALYREIREPDHPGPPSLIEPPLLIFRYSGDSAPDVARLEPEMKNAVARAVSILSNKIQGQQTPSV